MGAGIPPRMIDKGNYASHDRFCQRPEAPYRNQQLPQTDFAKSSFEANKAYFEKLAGVKYRRISSLNSRREYTKYRPRENASFAEATKMGEL